MRGLGGVRPAVIGVLALATAATALTGCSRSKNSGGPAATASTSVASPGASSTPSTGSALPSASVSGDPAAITLYRQSMAALAKAGSVHMKGTGFDGGSRIGVDIRFVRDTGATGSLTIGGGTIKIISVGGHLYLNVDATALQGFAGGVAPSGSVAVIAGKWLDLGSTKSSNPLGDFSQFADLGAFASQFTPSGAISLADTKTVNGEKAIGIKDTGGSNGSSSVLYVEQGNDHLPLQLISAGGASSGSSATSGVLNFVDYNAAVSITAPSGAISMDQLAQLFGGPSSATPTA